MVGIHGHVFVQPVKEFILLVLIYEVLVVVLHVSSPGFFLFLGGRRMYVG